MDEDDHHVGGWGHRAACVGAACLMMVNKGAMPPRKYNGYSNPIAPIHRGVDMMMDEEDHSVRRSWQEKWDFVERCMEGKPRMYNSWKTWARECDDRSKNSAFYDEQDDEYVGSDELGCYLFPQAPKCRVWDILNDDDDVGMNVIRKGHWRPDFTWPGNQRRL